MYAIPLIRRAAGLLLLSILPSMVMASEPYPNRPIRLLVGFGPGGPTDITFRQLAELASKQLGQPIVVENKPGVGATLAASMMAKQNKPDGYTIAAATAGMLRVPYMQKVDWDPIRDFTWISGLGGYTFVLAVKADSPYKTVDDLVTFAKSNPEALTVATAGAGSSMHLLAEALGDAAEINLTHIGYKSSSEGAVSVLGGHTIATVDAIGSIQPYVQSGSMRILMSFDERPAASSPEIPTAKSLGYDISYNAPYGLIGPKNMPRDVVNKLGAAFKAAVEDPAYKKLLENLGQQYWYSSPDEYPDFAAAYYATERSFVERAKLLRQP